MTTKILLIILTNFFDKLIHTAQLTRDEEHDSDIQGSHKLLKNEINRNNF